MAKLPGTGQATTLPAGDGIFNLDCSTTTPIVLNSSQRFDNILLTQTITLGLNLRLDTSLNSLLISDNWLVTVNGTEGNDGLCGTEDDIPTADSVARFIPQTVIDALNSLYGSATIGNLFDLANRALGGQATAGVSLNDINAAVSAVNEAFDNCRFMVDFFHTNPLRITSIGNMDADENVIRAYPNPLQDAATFEFRVIKSGKALLEVYNLKGQKIAALFDGYVEAGRTYKVNFDAAQISSGAYIYVFNTGDKSYRKRLIISK
jgi:hypothetical protein